MADFDFDELDKAVNGSLNPSRPSFSSPAPRPAPRESVAPTPASAADATSDTQAVPVRQSSRAPAARRSSGRFMDMVHPSSVMRSPQTSSRPQPVASPLDSYDVENTAPKPSISESDTSALDWSTPLESPFLPDAKVEKRPLGGNTPASQPAFEPEEQAQPEVSEEPQSEVNTMPDPIDFAAQATPIEETEGTGEVQKVPSESFAKEPEAFTFEETPVVIAEPAAKSPAAPAFEEELSGPTSITQQYSDKPSTQPQSGAIYDTEAYHQPLMHVNKKRSGLWVIFWIIFLVITGAAVGAGVYFYVLPLL